MSLFIPIHRGNLRGVISLVQSGEHVNSTNYGISALILASSLGHFSIVKYLVEEGADIHFQDTTGKTALMVASMRGYLPIVEYLIQHGSFIDQTDENGRTSIVLASSRGHLPIVEYLVEHGASIEHVDEEGKTSLDYAIERGHLEIVAYLQDIKLAQQQVLEHLFDREGVDPYLKNYVASFLG